MPLPHKPTRLPSAVKKPLVAKIVVSRGKLQRKEKLDAIGARYNRFFAEYDIRLLRKSPFVPLELATLNNKLNHLNQDIESRMRRSLLMSMRAKSLVAKKEAAEHAYLLGEMQSQLIDHVLTLEANNNVPKGFAHSLFRKNK